MTELKDALKVKAGESATEYAERTSEILERCLRVAPGRGC